MNFFKHFTHGHSSPAMVSLMNEWGVEGYGAYFILMEMCVDKITKGRDERLTTEHCRVRFHERQLREKLRMRATKVELFLNSCSTLVLLEFVRVEDEFHFYLPNVVKFLDRQSTRARPERVQDVPKEKEIEKEKEYKKKKPAAPDGFDEVVRLFGKPKGPEAEERFREQIKSSADLGELTAAIKHYHAMLKLDENSWRSSKTTFATFLGASKKPFWRDYIDPASCKPSGRGSNPPATRFVRPEPRPVNYSPAEKVLEEMHDQGPRGAVDVAALVSQAFGYHPKKGSA